MKYHRTSLSACVLSGIENESVCWCQNVWREYDLPSAFSLPFSLGTCVYDKVGINCANRERVSVINHPNVGKGCWHTILCCNLCCLAAFFGIVSTFRRAYHFDVNRLKSSNCPNVVYLELHQVSQLWSWAFLALVELPLTLNVAFQEVRRAF